MKNEDLFKMMKFFMCNESDPVVTDSRDHPYQIGETYLVETVTQFYTGTLTAVLDQELVLENASWIAQTGRYNEAFKTGFDEVEPLPDGFEIIGRGSIVSARILKIELPRSVR